MHISKIPPPDRRGRTVFQTVSTGPARHLPVRLSNRGRDTPCGCPAVGWHCGQTLWADHECSQATSVLFSKPCRLAQLPTHPRACPTVVGTPLAGVLGRGGTYILVNDHWGA